MKAIAVILFLLVLLPILAPTARAQKDVMVDVSPTVLEPGKMQTFTMEVRNLGEKALENVTVKIVSDETPVTIVGVGEQFIGGVEPYGTEIAHFSLYAEEGAESANGVKNLAISFLTGYTSPISRKRE